MKRMLWAMVWMVVGATAAWADAPKHQDITANCRALYPQSAWEKGLKGNTSLSFQVGADGKAKTISILRSSGITALDKAAVDCIAASRYKVPLDQSAEQSWQENIDFYTRGWWVGKPHYCTGYRPSNVEGRGLTELLFTITDEGRTVDGRVGQSNAPQALNDAALECLKEWRYRPAVKEGKPIAVPWKAFVIWGDIMPGPVAGDGECWKALWPRAEELEGVTGPTILSMITNRSEEISDLHVKTSSGVPALDAIAITCISRTPSLFRNTETAVEQPADYRRDVGIDWHKKLVP